MCWGNMGDVYAGNDCGKQIVSRGSKVIRPWHLLCDYQVIMLCDYQVIMLQ
jgi:hypothetical protein